MIVAPAQDAVIYHVSAALWLCHAYQPQFVAISKSL